MTQPFFDASRMRWHSLAGIAHLHYRVLDIDEDHQTIDVLFKFAAGQQIVLHRHKVLNKTFVVAGEHRLYHADGALKEIRQAGQYISSPPCPEPHREGGGEEDAIVLFSIRGGGVLYEILDDAQNVIGELTWQNFVSLYQEQDP